MRFNCVNCLFSKQVAKQGYRSVAQILTRYAPLIKDKCEVYACLRYPPVTIFTKNAIGYDVPYTHFPAVTDQMICGEYRPAQDDPGSDSRPLTCGATHLFMNRIDNAKTN